MGFSDGRPITADRIHSPEYIVYLDGAVTRAKPCSPGLGWIADLEPSTVINAAMIAAGSGIVRLKNMFHTAATVNMVNSVILEAEGYGDYPCDGSAGGTGLYKEFNGDLVDASQVRAWQLRNMALYCNKANYTGRGLVVRSGVGNRPGYWALTDVKIMRPAGVGVDVNRAAIHWLTRTAVQEGDDDGVQVTDASDWVYESCSIGSHVGDAVHVVSGNGTINASQLFLSLHGVETESALKLTNNWVNDNTYHGYFVKGSRTQMVGNHFIRNNTGDNVDGSSVMIHDASRCLVNANESQDANGNIIYGIAESGTANVNDIVHNALTGHVTAAILPVGGDTKTIDNLGYNPVGNVLTPYPVAAGYILDVAAAQAFPTTHTTYTVGHSPKLLTLYGGTVSAILVDGVATGLTAGSFQLNPGQTFHVDWTVQPSSVVYAQ